MANPEYDNYKLPPNGTENIERALYTKDIEINNLKIKLVEQDIRIGVLQAELVKLRYELGWYKNPIATGYY